MNKIFNLIILFNYLIFSLTCKKYDNNIDPQWREKSISITEKVCHKLISCSQNTINMTNKKLNSYLNSLLNDSNCLENFKKSNVYNLNSKDIESMKNDYLSCSGFILNLNCTEIKNGQIKEFTPCQMIQKIQRND